MLTSAEHPVAWAMLLYQLGDAYDHLGSLIAQMQTAGSIEDAEYAVQLGHIFAHLNRAWHSRDDTELDQITNEFHSERSRFPTDLSPVG